MVANGSDGEGSSEDGSDTVMKILTMKTLGHQNTVQIVALHATCWCC